MLRKVESNEAGMVVCVDEAGSLLGVLTDGDFRRWAMSFSQLDLNTPVETIINREIVSARVTDSIERIASLLGHRVQFLPLTDIDGRCAALAKQRTAQFTSVTTKSVRVTPAL